MESYLTSVEVARRFGIGLGTLNMYLFRHPHLKPKKRAGTSFMWTAQEYETLAQHRMRPISRGPHAKKGG